MCPPFHRSKNSSRKRSGFALLITITLLAFLVLLLVSLASLTRVETQVSGNHQMLAQARQNALFGLNLALGELQRHAGPDQRVTAPSNTGTAATVPGRSDTQPHWTGVWKHTPPASSPSVAEEARTPELLTWLVSGNETSLLVTPSDAIEDPSATDESPTVWLVGDHSVEFSGSASLTNPDPRIKLTKQPIRSSELRGVPGEQTIGHYAWWVGDEGVKARADLVDEQTGPEAGVRRVLSAQKQSVAQMSAGLASFPATDADLAVLAGVVSDGQLPFAAPAVEVAEWKRRFHDLSVHSRGVLSDTRSGGLRRDLSWLLWQSPADFPAALATSWSDVGVAPSPVALYDNAHLIVEPGVSVPASFHAWTRGAPTWEQLRSYHALANEIGSATAIDARAQTATQHGVFPIVARARLFFGLRRERVTGGDGVPVPNQNRIFLHTRVSVVLANPYNVDLSGDYHLTVRKTSTPTLTFVASSNTADPPPNEAAFGGSWAVLLGSMKFRITPAEGIPAGQARIFTLEWGRSEHAWDAGTTSYAHVPAGTYVLTNDYDDGQASLRLEANRLLTDAECETVALWNVRPNFGVALWDATPSNHHTVLQFSPQVTGSANERFLTPKGAGLPDPAADPEVRWGGGIFYVVTDAWEHRSNTKFQTSVNYIAEVNQRAPLQAEMAGTLESQAMRMPVYTYGGANRSTPTAFSDWQEVMPDNRRVSWGLAYQPRPANGITTVQDHVLYAVPRASAPLVSLGQLQHFNAGGFLMETYAGANAFTFGQLLPISRFADLEANELSFTPAYAIGNSRGPRTVRREEVYTTQGGNTAGRYHDASYLLNTALWDRFYFSSFPQAGNFDFGSEHLLNARYAPFRTAVPANDTNAYRATATSASVNLLSEGAFNVNSTSVPAWTAFLGGLLNASYNGEQAATDAPYPRTPFQPGASVGTTRAATVTPEAWRGFRKLSQAEIVTLAEKIVEQVKWRGPFLSLSDFVNRRLVAAGSTSDPNGIGIRGALEAAIQASALNAAPPAGSRFAEPPYSSGLSEVEPAHRPINLIDGGPGALTQADLLQPLGPWISARSDTFRIRTYGDTSNPVTGRVEGRAWCEAVVQRLPDFVGSEDADTSLAAMASDSPSKVLGRRFVVVSFRWLGPGDL